MQYDAKTPDAYLIILDEDWRKDTLLQIRSLILSHKNPPKEYIQYKMLAYGGGENNTVFHLNAQKNYVSLYIGNIEKVPDGKEMLKGLDFGKGCIRIKKSTDLSGTNLRTFIHDAIELWRSGDDVNC